MSGVGGPDGAPVPSPPALFGGAFARRTLAALPARIRERVEADELTAERFIARSQLVVVVIVGLLYALALRSGAPVAGAAGVPLPVPVVLGAFGLYALGRLALLRRGLPPRWLVLAGVAGEFALLYGLIVAYHWQYGQPAAFSLKSPTQAFAFLFIALRALRFDPGAVLFAGFVAASGWLAVAAYAVRHDGPGSITHDYLTYTTSHRVLVGTEVERAVVMMAVACVLAFGIERARRRLVEAAIGSSARDDLARFFAPGLAERIALSPQAAMAGSAEERDGAVLVADLRGFTALTARLDARATLALIAEFQALVVMVADRHGGAVDKFLGDGALVTFGCVKVSERAAAAAVEAAADLAREGAEWALARQRAGMPAARLGCAVAAGPLLFALVGTAERLEVTVIGDAANRATKLEKHTKAVPCAALTDRATLALAAAQGARVEARLIGGASVAGLEGLVDLAVLA